jgi:NAD(P)-dependent dehydrogenase (short-subunit alcohol dehydrogenase family)
MTDTAGSDQAGESTWWSSMFSMEGVAIVTGASSGIGAHAAELFARAGMTVVAAARRTERLADLASRVDGVVAHRCDVGVDEDLRELAEFAASLGPVSLLVNNAGISDAVTPAEAQDPGQFRRVVEINLNATFVLSALVAGRAIERGHALHIVNIASIHGLVAGAPNAQAAYAASKAGVIGLTRELAGQWARRSITVNAIAPGYFHTELTDLMFESEESGLRYIRRNTMVGRPGELRELDGTLLLLGSSAGSYLTGQTIAVDGGWTAR